MPIYTYRCTNCGHEWTDTFTVEDYRMYRDCPECDGEQSAVRIYTGQRVGLDLRGTGWPSKDIKEGK